MAELPSGTVTFLFTDIERSTENVALFGDERYADLLQVHRDLVRKAFGRHAGVEVGTEGDAFFVAFSRAGDAVNAAIDAQRDLEAYPWPADMRLRVRMGLHTGEALVRGDDYVGHDVHKAKRICDAGHGGQILLSEATTGLVSTHLPAGAFITDLGQHRLKDLGDAERIHQLGADGLPVEFPGLRSLDAFTHNLPSQRSAFIGREQEIVDIQKLLEMHRLVTLTGVGGCGKTRLAVQVGAELLDRYPDGVFFVDLAPLADPELVARTVATAVGAPPGATIAGGFDPSTVELLLEYLTRRECLVLLDNCEHLLDDCAELVDRILVRCPQVVILATSREALDVEGEQSWRIPSLSLPADNSDIQESEAVSLFKARAQAVQPAFDLTPQNIGAVVEICRRLDGIPLAIEFAASRVSHMAPQEIADRLGDMFRLLIGGRRRAQRQQTLQAALDWSYELLSSSEQSLLQRLAVFSGGFTLEATEGTCTDELVARHQVLDLLGSLVTKSLVSFDDQGSGTRYRLLETVRLYAAEKLREAHAADVFRSRQRDWYLGWVRSFSWDQVFSSSPTFDALERDHANLRAAMEWSASEGRADLVVAMATRMMGLWAWFGHTAEGFRWLTLAAPEDLDIELEERVAALMEASMCSIALMNGAAVDFADRAIAAAAGQPIIAHGFALAQRGVLRSVAAESARDPELAAASRNDIDQAIRLVHTSRPTQGSILVNRSMAEAVLHEWDAATEALVAGVDRFDPIENAHLLAWGQVMLAGTAFLAGQHELALRTANSISRQHTMRGWESGAVIAIALGRLGGGDIQGAEQALREGTDEVRRSGNPGTLEELVTGFVALAAHRGDYARASRLLGWIRSRVFESGQISRSQTSYGLYLRHVAEVRDALPRDDGLRLRDEGRAMSEDEAVAYALEGLQTV